MDRSNTIKQNDEVETQAQLFCIHLTLDNGSFYFHVCLTFLKNFLTELRDAILRRHPGILDKAIARVEESEYKSELSQSLDTARKLRQHLTELDQYRHDILTMDQSTTSEIRSYHHPPDGVHEVMIGTYMLLGYEEEKLQVGSECLLYIYI